VKAHGLSASGAARPLLSGASGAHDFAPAESRVVQSEILDTLPHDSPAAWASRRDLRVINCLLRSHAWFSAVLRERCWLGEGVLEIGAGTGELGRALHAFVPELAGLDRMSRPCNWPPLAPWFETDVLSFGRWREFPVVIGNLFFHHFDGERLARIGAQLDRHARLIVASEPLRAPRARRLFSLLCPLIGAHPVTRHDGRVSIGAGFRGEELPRLLRLDPSVWRWRIRESWLGASRLVAERRA
jgi:hypothetical protein